MARDARTLGRSRRKNAGPLDRTAPATGGSVADDAPGLRNARWGIAFLLVLGFFFALRVGAWAPWSYDDFYHLGVARELRADFPLESLPWTPYALQAESYADKEFLFHLLLMPLANLPLDGATSAGVLSGVAFLAAAVAYFLIGTRVARGHLWLLALTALGPFFCLRVEALRPHVGSLAFAVLFVGALQNKQRPWVLALISGTWGLFHTAGWLGIAFAVVWSVCAKWAPAGSLGSGGARFEASPAIAASLGWLAGQLLHPNLPRNFELAWIQNVLVPLGALGGVGGGGDSVRSVIGVELTRPPLAELLQQWPMLLAPLAVAGILLTRRAARTGPALALASTTFASLLVGALWMRRFLEFAAVFAILTLAQLVAEARARGEGSPWPLSRPRLAVGLVLLGAAWTTWMVRDFGRGDLRPQGRGQPIEMARFLAANGREGEFVYSTQWADSAPLLYAAPQLHSLVFLDPNFLAIRDRQRFDRYFAIASGQSGDPVGELQREFGATWVTVWKAPAFQNLARQLRRDPHAAMKYSDPFYEVWRLHPRS